MAHHVIEYDARCETCGGTGLYKGMAEGDGFAVVCAECKGSGEVHHKEEYDDFEELIERKGISRVLQVNPGIGCGVNKELNETDFGGMSYSDWKAGKPFPKGSEMRRFTCPAWWYQCADYNKKPSWDTCLGAGMFSGCAMFKNKHLCWERWDKEFGKL